MHQPLSLSQKLNQYAPKTISIFLDGIEILRIEEGKKKHEGSVHLNQPHWLLTVHFDDNPKPEYVIQIA